MLMKANAGSKLVGGNDFWLWFVAKVLHLVCGIGKEEQTGDTINEMLETGVGVDADLWTKATLIKNYTLFHCVQLLVKCV